MKRIFKNYAIIAFASALAFTSCEEATVGNDEELNYNTITSVVQFPAADVTASAVADGENKTYNAKIMVAGPNVEALEGDITATFEIDSDSSAEEGVNYILENNTVTLKKSQNYLANIPITIITEGIEPPSNESLILRIASLSTGEENVVISGNKYEVMIDISYSCFADLAGTYAATNDFCYPAGLTIDITPNSDGSWNLTSADGYWLSECTGNSGLFNAGNLFVVCGSVLPSSDLDYGAASGYNIGNITGGTWDPDAGTNGVLRTDNTEGFFNGGPYSWESIYTRL